MMSTEQATPTDKTRELVYLAGLLHDIGKFYQRADGLWNGDNELKQDTRKLSGTISYMTDRGTPSHQHVYWTNQFLEDHKAAFQQLKLWTEERDSLLTLAANHHRPQTELQALIALADSWASGLDRTETKAEDDVTQETSDIKWGWKRYKRLPLVNMLTRMQIGGQTPVFAESQSKVFGLHPLSLADEALTQRSLGNDPPDLASDYRKLWDSFVGDFKRLPTGDLTAFSDTLFQLLRQYTWGIPADTQQNFCDMSLFHHLKMVGALAQCLYDHRDENQIAYQFDGRRIKLKEGYPVQLLCVDLSGIQNYIYSIASTYAAKSLKGRSFSLQLLLDGIARRIIQETRTTPGHLVYSSGGKFFMLLPNTKHINTVLNKLETDIQREVWDEFQGNLFVCFGRIAFAYDTNVKLIWAELDGKAELIQLGNSVDLATKKARKGLWSLVADKAAEQKQQKNHTLLLDSVRFSEIFEAAGRGGEAKQCAVTGQEGNLVQPDKDNDTLLIHRSVNQQIRIGDDLTGHTYLITGKGQKYPLLAGAMPFTPEEKRPKQLLPGTDVCLTLQPPSTHSESSHFIGNDPSTSYSFRFYGGSRVALRHNTSRQKNFEELAGIVREDPDRDDSPIVREKCEGGYNRLAVLRMDVDSLGKLFTHGFAPERASFSAYATLSGLLDWFFSGYLNTIRERQTKEHDFKDWVNIIYSGGDDVFAVGRWDRIICFADAVQQEFKKFTGRDDLTISAGIELMRPRFPIGKAADAAGEAEDRAKDHVVNGKVKNAVSLFGLAVNWDIEWPQVVIWKTKLVDWLDSRQLSKGILQKLFEYYDIYRKDPADLSWKWNAAYSLARHRRTDNQDVIKALQQVLFVDINENRLRFEAFAIALRWAELEYRDKSKN